MSTFRIRQGRDIRIKGAAEKRVVDLALPQFVAVQPLDFRGLKARLSVKEGDSVKVGTPLFADKTHPGITVVSPACGKVAAINRGEERVLLNIVIETDARKDIETHKAYSEQEIEKLSRQDVINHLLAGGLWAAVRQRPFSKVANPTQQPKAVFVHAMNTEPLSADIDFILENKKKEFQAGLDAIRKLTAGKTHLCVKEGSKSTALTQAKGVEIQQFSGPHPAGNVSTHIHYVDPIHKGDVVWYVEAQDVLRIAKLFLYGVYSAERIVAVTGEAAKNRGYVKTVIGAPMSALLQGSNLENIRCISGSILAGKNAGKNGFLGFYDSQVTAIPEGGKRELLGWMSPGFKKFTLSKTYASAFMPQKNASLTTDEYGSHRAVVLNHIYDQFVPLDIMTYFLIKAVYAGDIEEAEKLGILECDEEDFALCTFACPSKTDVGVIIRSGLDVVEKEENEEAHH